MSEVTRPLLVEPTWLHQLQDYIRAVDLADEGEQMAVGDASGQVSILEQSDGRCRQRWSLHDHPITGLRWANPNRLVSTGEDGTVQIIDPGDDGQEIAQIETDAMWIDDLDIDPLGKRLAFCAGRRAHVFSLEGESIWKSKPHESTISGVAFLPKESLVATSCYGAMRIWNYETGREVELMKWKGSLFEPHPSPDGAVVACGCQDDSVHFWRLETGRDSEMSGYPAKPRCLAWSRDSKLLATSAAHVQLVWDFSGTGPEGTTPYVLPVHEKAVTTMDFHPRRNLLLSGAEDAMIMWWTPEEDSPPMGLAMMMGELAALRWLPEGDAFIAGDANGYVGRFDPKLSK